MNPSTTQLREFSHKAKMYPEEFYHTQARTFSGLSCCFLPAATVEKFLLVHWWLLWNGRHREEFVPAWDSGGAPHSLKSQLRHSKVFPREVLMTSPPFGHLWGFKALKPGPYFPCQVRGREHPFWLVDPIIVNGLARSATKQCFSSLSLFNKISWQGKLEVDNLRNTTSKDFFLYRAFRNKKNP